MSLGLYGERKQNYQNANIHRKLKVPTSVILPQPKIQYEHGGQLRGACIKGKRLARTGIRIRVAHVRGWYPNQLDYTGLQGALNLKFGYIYYGRSTTAVPGIRVYTAILNLVPVCVYTRTAAVP